MTMVCFVMFSDVAKFNDEALRDVMNTSPNASSRIADIERKSDTIYRIEFSASTIAKQEPAAVFLSQMPAFPADPEQAETSGPLWPDAAEKLATNQSHWIVTTAGSQLPPLDEAWLLSRVVEAILQTHPTAVGVLWNKHGLKASSESFRKIMASLGPQELPILLWVDITVIPGADSDSPMASLTTGMDAFNLMEIENIGSPEPPSEMHARLLGICEYLLSNGPVLLHGNSIGESDEERITIVHSKSAFGRDGTVIHLSYPNDEIAKGLPVASDGPANVGSGLKSVLSLLGIMVAMGATVFTVVKLVGWTLLAVQGDNVAIKDGKSNPVARTHRAPIERRHFARTGIRAGTRVQR